ncbi:MAG: GNAT family N-acetyltransferase [Desulfobacula sp.]|nr:GNAT family N-acetyltransferase [Desulfobacula sp.]
MEWQLKLFKELGIDELYELLKLRVDVFVVEQNCPYPEIDEKDRYEKTIHLLGKDHGGTVVAYLRILPPGLSFKEVSIGRVVVAKTARELGLSHKMVQKALGKISLAWPGENIKIGAQLYLKTFYETYGFKPVSDSYLEDGIPHIDMLKIS